MSFPVLSPMVWLALLALCLGGCSQPDESLSYEPLSYEPDAEPLVIRGNTMGTTYSVKVVLGRAQTEVETAGLKTAIDLRLRAINQVMSTYIADSELSLLNQAPVGELQPLSDENRYVLEIAAKVHEMSGGMLDITIGPLVNLWGFGPDPSKVEVPAPSLIRAAGMRVGFDKLLITSQGLTKTVDGLIDLSTVAKGYAVDEIAALLISAGHSDYLVEIGGELIASGRNTKGQFWRIAVEKPDVLRREIFKVLPLDNMGMATSGDYRNYFEVEGKRFSHMIDPNTGYPITNRVASVTVLAASAAMADALATAINVMGEEAGLAMAEAHKLLVFVILKTPEGFETRYSSAFEAYLRSHP